MRGISSPPVEGCGAFRLRRAVRNPLIRRHHQFEGVFTLPSCTDSPSSSVPCMWNHIILRITHRSCVHVRHRHDARRPYHSSCNPCDLHGYPAQHAQRRGRWSIDGKRSRPAGVDRATAARRNSQPTADHTTACIHMHYANSFASFEQHAFAIMVNRPKSSSSHR